jgi:hypothetical protein
MKEQILAELEKITRPGANMLRAFLTTSDFFTAPASTQYHLAVPGGLATHSWNVYESLAPIVKKYIPETDIETVIICGLLHDICKANFYTTATRNAKNEKTGVWEKVPYITVADQDPLGHGEKSVIIIQRHIPLNPAEALAIRWHMGAWEADGYGPRKALGAAIDICPLLRALMLADQLSTYFIEDRKAS